MTVVSVVILGLLVSRALRQDEPVYLGRTLTTWLDDSLQDGHLEDAFAPSPAQTAVRHIGTNGIPYLLEMIRAKDSAARRFVIGLERRQDLFQPRLLSDQDKHGLGVTGFEMLGPLGKPALPDLMQLLGDPDPQIRMSVVYCLGRIGPEARDAVPLLLPFLDGTNQSLAWAATEALGAIHAEPASVVPLLIRNLDTNISLRYRAMTMVSLGAFGAQAQAAVPAIVPFLRDRQAGNREAATNALRAIQSLGVGRLEGE
jgi:HEAT repeat protein